MSDITGAMANAAWPDLGAGYAVINPPRNGMDRYTGKLLQGWPHVEQSLSVIFITPFGQRVLRGWVGSFVPVIFGRNLVARTITRFFWAIMTAIDLWEPDFRIVSVQFMGQVTGQSNAVTEAEVRVGQLIFRQVGVWYPRGNLGDYTPAGSQTSIARLISGG